MASSAPSAADLDVGERLKDVTNAKNPKNPTGQRTKLKIAIPSLEKYSKLNVTSFITAIYCMASSKHFSHHIRLTK